MPDSVVQLCFFQGGFYLGILYLAKIFWVRSSVEMRRHWLGMVPMC